MVQFKYITEHKERKGGYPYRVVWVPHLTVLTPGLQEHTDWTLDPENAWMVNFHVEIDDKPQAEILSKELWDRWTATKDPNDTEVIRIATELKKLRAKDHSDFTPLERWTWNALQMMEYSGNVNLLVLIFKKLSRYRGRIMEVFCGHNSYFTKKKGSSITALDYCESSLLRYTHQEAERICCDLNQVQDVGDLDFLEDNSFDVISICFGYKYPEDIFLLMKEFMRILKPGGVLSFVESETHGFVELMQRQFTEALIVEELRATGFSRVKNQPINQLPGKMRREPSILVYHVQAFK